MKSGLYFNSADFDDLKKHFHLLHNEFINQIEQKIDLNKYLEKIYKNAKLYEYWEKSVLIGFAAVYENNGIENPAYLTNISVVKGKERMGIASNLLQFVIESLKTKGYKYLDLEAKKNNNIALEMYTKKGFTVVGEKEKDSLLMQIHLYKEENP